MWIHARPNRVRGGVGPNSGRITPYPDMEPVNVGSDGQAVAGASSASDHQPAQSRNGACGSIGLAGRDSVGESNDSPCHGILIPPVPKKGRNKLSVFGGHNYF